VDGVFCDIALLLLREKKLKKRRKKAAAAVADGEEFQFFISFIFVLVDVNEMES
jgi:hypothetical protein